MTRKSFNTTGFPNSVIMYNTEYEDALVVESGILNVSKPKIFTGNASAVDFIIPTSGNRILIKGITITGDGNTGKVYLIRSKDGSVIFPAYFSAQVKGGPSSALNYLLDANEKIQYTATDRGTSESYIGVSYIELNPNYED